ncbi:hypothetical protein NO2_0831 [Candidatus Termititenax persephonae]|uniref:Uncharacterized protein n=1 Tax=Candidatus Termititenax persephonae TaxID=2218525 RepID=A0A388THQ8_9BACT|nr:hypothetical protein NO2_0831 [Candidatus Termititenax persephonae]
MLNTKLLANRENNIIFLTHFMAPAGKRGNVIYNTALYQLGRLGQIIQIEDAGIWNYNHNYNYAGRKNAYNEVGFTSALRRPIEKPNELFIFKKLYSPDGQLDIGDIQDDIMDKNLFFGGYSLYCCVRNTIFSVAPIAAIKKQSQVFTLLKDYLWAEVIINNNIHSHVLKIPHGYLRFYNQYLEIPAWPILKKSLKERYVFPPTPAERERLDKVYDYYGINLFFHYAGTGYPIYARHRNKLRIDLVLR